MMRRLLLALAALSWPAAVFAEDGPIPNPYLDDNKARNDINDMLSNSLGKIGPDYHGQHRYFNDDLGNVGLVLMLLLCVAGPFLEAAIPFVARWGVVLRKKVSAEKLILLLYAAAFLVTLGLFLTRYWPTITTMRIDPLFAAAVVLATVGGMFAQVMNRNRAERRPLLQVTAGQLLRPLVFLPVVLLICTMSGLKESPLFALFTAFQAGYCWESVVATLKLPESKP
jgi:hypothetical protein